MSNMMASRRVAFHRASGVALVLLCATFTATASASQQVSGKLSCGPDQSGKKRVVHPKSSRRLHTNDHHVAVGGEMGRQGNRKNPHTTLSWAATKGRKDFRARGRCFLGWRWYLAVPILGETQKCIDDTWFLPDTVGRYRRKWRPDNTAQPLRQDVLAD